MVVWFQTEVFFLENNKALFQILIRNSAVTEVKSDDKGSHVTRVQHGSEAERTSLEGVNFAPADFRESYTKYEPKELDKTIVKHTLVSRIWTCNTVQDGSKTVYDFVILVHSEGLL